MVSKAKTVIIAIQHENESLTSVRLLRNAQPEKAGEILTEHYPSPHKVKELLSSGDIITLKSKAEQCKYCEDDTLDWGNTSPEEHKHLGLLFARYVNHVDFIYIYSNNYKWYCHECKG